MGAGEALSGGQTLTQPKRLGPPVNHVIEALERAGAELAQGRAVSLAAQRLISKTPLPLVPFAIWRWMFTTFGGHWWKQHAREYGVKKEDMSTTPYAD
jgi:hypothetical protein